METTARALRRAALGHLVLSAAFAVATLAVWRLGVGMATQHTVVRSTTAALSEPASVGLRSPGHELQIVTIFLLVAACLAAYHVWQWRRKSRRYRYQRRRAANELLRDDFKVTGRC